MVMEDFYSNSSSQSKRFVLQRRHYNGDVIGAVSAATDLLENAEVEAILGPQSSGEAEFVAKLGNRARVPVISFTATSPSLSLDKDGYFLRAAQSDENQVDAIADIMKAYGWGEVVPIYEDSEFGRGMIPYLTDTLQQMNVKLPSRSFLAKGSREDQIKKELYRLKRLKSMQTRVFVVHMEWASLGRRLFKLVRELEMLMLAQISCNTNQQKKEGRTLRSHGGSNSREASSSICSSNGCRRRWNRVVRMKPPQSGCSFTAQYSRFLPVAATRMKLVFQSEANLLSRTNWRFMDAGPFK